MRALAVRTLGVASIVLSLALAGGVAADTPVEQAEAAECEQPAEGAQAASEPGATTDGAAPKCPVVSEPQPPASFEDLMKGRQVVPLNTRGYNYKKPDEIRGEVPSRNSAAPPGVPRRPSPAPNSAD